MKIVSVDVIPKSRMEDSECKALFREKTWLSYLLTNRVDCQLALCSPSAARNIKLFLLLSGASDHQVQAAADFVIQNLNFEGYQTAALSSEKELKVQEMIFRCLCGGSSAVAKAEMAVTSYSSYSGFYYFADLMLPSSLQNSWLTPLCDFLLKERDYCVLFQLTPTELSNLEIAALSELSSALQRISEQGMLMCGGMPGREPFLREPQTVYNHYAKLVHQPLFQFGIVVGSAFGNDAKIAQYLSNLFASDTGDVPRMWTLSLPNISDLANDLDLFPAVLYNDLFSKLRNPQIWQSSYPPNALARLPFLLSMEECSMIMRLPVDDGRIRGFTSSSIPVSNEVVPRTHTPSASNGYLQFGYRLGQGEEIECPLPWLTQHALIVGMPGTGKTTFALNLLLQLHKQDIPFLVVEPTKTEYRALFGKIPDLRVYTPGNSAVSPMHINPFLPPDGVTMEQYVPSLSTAFRAAFSLTPPLDTLFENVIRRCYALHGWRSYNKTGDPNAIPFGLFEFILEFKKMISETDYGKELKGNLQSAGTMRLINLIEQNPVLYDSIYTTPISELLSHPTVIELNSIEGQEQKSLLMALLLIQVCTYTKHRRASGGILKNVFLIDEAHVLLAPETGNSNVQGAREGEAITSRALQNMVAEVRAFGTGILIADQSPTKVGSGILANTNIKVTFQLVDKGEKEAISNCMNLSSEQERAISNLKAGQAFVFMKGFETPQVVQTPDVRNLYSIDFDASDEEVRDKMKASKDISPIFRPFLLCENCIECKGGCDPEIREEASYHARLLYSQRQKELRVQTCKTIASVLCEWNDAKDMRHLKCTVIHLFRYSSMNLDIQVPSSVLAKALRNI